MPSSKSSKSVRSKGGRSRRSHKKSRKPDPKDTQDVAIKPSGSQEMELASPAQTQDKAPPTASVPDHISCLVDSDNNTIDHSAISAVSSALTQVNSQYVAAQFPYSGSPSIFTDQKNLLEQLSLGVGLDEHWFNRLQEVGWVTPHQIVNAFGLDRATVAQHFLWFGYKFLFDSRDVATSLFLFAQGQILGYRVLPTEKQLQVPFEAHKKGGGV